MKATFEKTVDILVKAYLNDTLERGFCSCCAVGNLVAHALGTKSILSSNAFENGVQAEWRAVTAFYGTYLMPDNYRDETKRQIDATGYTWRQIARIEAAFELAKGPTKDREFNGLMAVVDVLADIHGISLEKKAEAKALFVK